MIFLARHTQPAVQLGVTRDHSLSLALVFKNVCGAAGERPPAERADATPKYRADISGYKAGIIKRICHTRLIRHLPEVVAVIDDRNTLMVELQHGAHLLRNRFLRSLYIAFRVTLAQFRRFPKAQTGRDISVEDITRRCVIGDHIRLNPPSYQFGIDVSRIAQQSDRERLSEITSFADLIKRLVQRTGDCIAVAGIQTALDVLLVYLNGKHGGAGHCRSEWLRTCHPSQTRRQYPFTG